MPAVGAYSQNPAASGAPWDAWSHYHIMYGLYLWYKAAGNQKYLDAMLKAADLFIKTFYNGKKRMVSIGWAEMNMAPYHIFAMLYNETKDKKYLDFAMEIEADLAHESAGNYINYSLSGFEYFECPKPRWESMHIILGIAEMYKCTGDEKYLRVAKQI
jgi:rhamnogalacturonyl hydrolase YesR